MSIEELFIYGIISAIIVLYINHKQNRSIIEKIKITTPISKHIEVLEYFKGDKFTIKDVRESEINRIYEDIKNDFNIKGLRKKFIKVALLEKIRERKGTRLDNYREKDTTIGQIDQMSGIEFEYFLKRFFERSGYKVIITPPSGDQGVDLLLYCKTRKIAIQAKRYRISNKVGNSAIQEVSTGKLFYDCDDAYVITTSFFTNQAITLAKKVDVKLINRNHFELLLKGKFKL